MLNFFERGLNFSSQICLNSQNRLCVYHASNFKFLHEYGTLWHSILCSVNQLILNNTATLCIQGYCFSGIYWNLEMSGNSAKVRERSGNLCSQGYLNWHNACDVHGHVLRTSYNLPALYSYFDVFCISDVQRFELTLVSCWNAPQSS